MRSIRFVLLGSGLFFGLLSAAIADERQGTWLRGDGIARVNVAPCGQALCMTNVWIKPGSGNEKVGEYIRLDLQPSGPGRWNGTGHDPQRNIDFTTEMVVSGERMTTSGCALGGLLCRSTPWSRQR